MAEITLTLPNAIKEAGAAYGRGQLDRAERLARAICAAKADHFDALHLIAVIASRQQRFEDALAGYERALAVRPDHADALYNRGATLYELKRFDEALASYERALALRPDHAEAHYSRGLTLRALNRLEEALTSFERAVALRPNVEALRQRGLALKALERFDEALVSYDRALALRPDHAQALNNRGVVLRQLYRFDAALASYARALALAPDYAEAHYNAAHVRLLTGDLAGGWRQYEWRWRTPSLELKPRAFAQPLWLGESETKGKTILLHGEQGFGDTIQFCRYASLLAARGARVLLQVPAPLQALVQSLDARVQVVGAQGELPRFDLHCPFLSLPLAFATTLKTIPCATPYLRAPAEGVRRWHDALGGKHRPRIGLVWSGSRLHKNDRNRSIELAALLALLHLDATFVSLQSELRPEDARILQGRSDMSQLGDQLTDFAETAALIANLDLVISVDTSVAQQAVALQQQGKLAQAEPLYLRILELRTEHFDALHLLGTLRHQQGHHTEALELIRAALRIKPNDAFALSNFAVVLDELDRREEALAYFDKALAIKADDAETLYCRATTLGKLERDEEALTNYDRALSIRPDYVEALYNRGNLLKRLDRHREAVASYDRALAARPGFLKALLNRAGSLKELGRIDEALASLKEALALAPEHPKALVTRGEILEEMKRPDEALADYEKALAIEPDEPLIFSCVASASVKMCDWSKSAQIKERLEQHVRDGKSVTPFTFLTYSDDPHLQLQCAKTSTAVGGTGVWSRQDQAGVSVGGLSPASHRIPHRRAVRAARSLPFRSAGDLLRDRRPHRHPRAPRRGVRPIPRCDGEGRRRYRSCCTRTRWTSPST
jgi:tetratricopeptide (TPR) repeat protein